MQFKVIFASLFLASAAIAAPVAQRDTFGARGLESITETISSATNSISGSGNGNHASNEQGNGSGSGNGNGSGSDNSAGNGSGSDNSAGNGNKDNGNNNGNGNASPSDFLNNFGNLNLGGGEADCDQDVEQNGLVNLNVAPCVAL